MTSKIIPLAAMERLMKGVGAERVSDEAKIAMKEFLEDIGEKISKDALKLAEHARRKTIKASDIKLASKNL